MLIEENQKGFGEVFLMRSRQSLSIFKKTNVSETCFETIYRSFVKILTLSVFWGHDFFDPKRDAEFECRIERMEEKTGKRAKREFAEISEARKPYVEALFQFNKSP